RAARVSRTALRQMVAPGSHRVRRGDPEDGGRKVPQDSVAGAVRRVTGRNPLVAETWKPWEDRVPGGPHVWRTLGYRRTIGERGRVVLEWDAPTDYAFPAESGYIIHGGLVATVLDTAMGGACFSVLDDGETFLTADLHVEFFRPARPGTVRAEGRVIHRTK